MAPSRPTDKSSQKTNKKAPSASDDGSSLVTADGHSVDAKKMAKLLDDAKIHKDEMDNIRNFVDKGEAVLANRVRRNGATAAAVAAIVSATLASISKEKPSNVGGNTTASGNTINANIMKSVLEEYKINGTMISNLRSAILGGEDHTVSSLMVLKVLQKHGSADAKTALALVCAVIKATVKVAPPKPDKPIEKTTTVDDPDQKSET